MKKGLIVGVIIFFIKTSFILMKITNESLESKGCYKTALMYVVCPDGIMSSHGV